MKELVSFLFFFFNLNVFATSNNFRRGLQGNETIESAHLGSGSFGSVTFPNATSSSASPSSSSTVAMSQNTTIEAIPSTSSPATIFGNRILIMTLSFDLTHSDSMDEVLQEYLNMCEGGWDVTVIVYTTEAWSPDLLTFHRRRTYCYRLDDSVTFKFSVHPKSIGITLASVHRKELSQYLPYYDVFMYHEDDIIFRYKHLTAWVLVRSE